MMKLLSQVGSTPGVYTITNSGNGYIVNGGPGGWTTNYGNEFDKFNQPDWSDDFDIDDLYDGFWSSGPTTDKNVYNYVLSLLKQIEELQKLLDKLKGNKGTTPYPSGEEPWCDGYTWNRDLKLGDEGEDVRMLQRFLNAQPGIKIAESGPGSPGKESTFFGLGTERALIKFQEQHPDELLKPIGETKGTGYFGNITKKFIKKLCGGQADGGAFPLTVTIDDLEVTAKFGLENGCKGYKIDWGDGKTSELKGTDGPMCTQLYRQMAIDHKYSKAGTYTIKVTITGGGVSAKSVSKKVVVGEGEDDITVQPWTWLYNTPPNPEGDQFVPKQGVFIVTFEDDGTFSAKTDCNNMGGEYDIDGDEISIGEISTTLKYCSGSQEQQLADTLSQAETFRIVLIESSVSGRELRLTLEDGTIATFR